MSIDRTPTVGMPLTVVDARGVKGPGVVVWKNDSGFDVRVDFEHQTVGVRKPHLPGQRWTFYSHEHRYLGLTLIFKPFEEEGGERDDGINADMVRLVREASLAVVRGNCTFVDDDLKVLAHLANRAIEAGLTDGLPDHIQAKVAALRQPSANQGEVETLGDCERAALRAFASTDMCYSFRALEYQIEDRPQPFSRAVIEASVRLLKARGLVESRRGLFDEDGSTCGSGHCATEAGRKLAADLPPAPTTEGGR